MDGNISLQTFTYISKLQRAFNLEKRQGLLNDSSFWILLLFLLLTEMILGENELNFRKEFVLKSPDRMYAQHNTALNYSVQGTKIKFSLFPCPLSERRFYKPRLCFQEDVCKGAMCGQRKTLLQFTTIPLNSTADESERLNLLSCLGCLPRKKCVSA